MNVLGSGSANGGISLLHAFGLGRGSSVGIELSTRVSIVEGPNREVVGDYHRLLDAVISTWNSEGLPNHGMFYWKVESNVPIGQGLKSSSALACAALRALDSISWTGLSVEEIADLAVTSQKLAKCTITGSLDDAWSSLSCGWKLVDPELPASQSVLLEGEMDPGLEVLIGLRGIRSSTVSREKFSENSHLFERSLASIVNGAPLEALSANGLAVAASTEDFDALRICNHSIAHGAIASGMSGSGPAIAVICYESDKETIIANLSDFGMDVISTRFSTTESVVEEVH
ncbi:MAG: hypothetical protein QGH38_00085 [Candidatus Thalassarchaeaceae archaeon]|jgi:shikimate kinase|nr:hypothetical protein [Candidatus Thalassarchaeaceae archaeon]